MVKVKIINIQKCNIFSYGKMVMQVNKFSYLETPITVDGSEIISQDGKTKTGFFYDMKKIISNISGLTK